MSVLDYVHLADIQGQIGSKKDIAYIKQRIIGSDLEAGIRLLTTDGEDWYSDCVEDLDWDRLFKWNAPHETGMTRHDKMVVRTMIEEHGFSKTVHAILNSFRDIDGKGMDAEEHWRAPLVAMLWEGLQKLKPTVKEIPRILTATKRLLVEALTISLINCTHLPDKDRPLFWLDLKPPAFLRDQYDRVLIQGLRTAISSFDSVDFVEPLLDALAKKDPSSAPFAEETRNRVMEKCFTRRLGFYALDYDFQFQEDGSYMVLDRYASRFIESWDRMSNQQRAFLLSRSYQHLDEVFTRVVIELAKTELEHEEATHSEGAAISTATLANAITDYYKYLRESRIKNNSLPIEEIFPDEILALVKSQNP